MTLLSICIPCYGRVEYVRKTLKSIFIDNADVPLEKYEVIISDNDSNQAIKVLTEEFKYPNLRYFYTNCEGFMNSYYVLTYAQGEFFKLHNSQTLFRKGSLSKIISEIKNNIENKTLIFIQMDYWEVVKVKPILILMILCTTSHIGLHGVMGLIYGNQNLIK